MAFAHFNTTLSENCHSINAIFFSMELYNVTKYLYTRSIYTSENTALAIQDTAHPAFFQYFSNIESLCRIFQPSKFFVIPSSHKKKSHKICVLILLMSVLFAFCCCCCCYFPKWKAHLVFRRTRAHQCHLHNSFLHCKSVSMKYIHHLHRRTCLLNNPSLRRKGNKNKKMLSSHTKNVENNQAFYFKAFLTTSHLVCAIVTIFIRVAKKVSPQTFTRGAIEVWYICDITCSA